MWKEEGKSRINMIPVLAEATGWIVVVPFKQKKKKEGGLI